MSTTAKTTKVLVIGATGFVGGTLLLNLLARRNASASGLDITVLVRNSTKAQKLRELDLGVRIVEGSADSLDALADATQGVDLVFDVANCDDELGADNLLKVLKDKFEASGELTKLVHMSGAALLADDAWGADVESNVYEDTNAATMSAFPDKAYHRVVDNKFLKADQEAYITSYLVIPGVVYGFPSNILVSSGIQKENNFQLRVVIGPVIALAGVPAAVGGGHNRWAVVEYSDLADLCMVLFTHLISPEWASVPHGADGYYFGENGETSIQRELQVASRAFTGGEPKEGRALDKEEVDKFIPYAHLFSANCRCKATRARQLGWKPSKDIDAFESIVEDFTKKMMNGEV